MTNFRGLAGLINLEKLYLSFINRRAEDGGPVDFACASGLQKLETLYVGWAEVVNEGEIAKLTALQLAVFDRINYKNDKPFSLAGLGKLTRLQKLSLDSGTVVDAAALAGCTGLKYLRLYNVRGLGDGAFLTRLPNLERLTTNRGLLADATVKALEAAGVRVEFSRPMQ